VSLRKIKKTWAVGFTAVGLVAAVTGCSSGASGNSATNSAAANGTGNAVTNAASTTANSGQPVTLTFLHWRSEDVPEFTKLIAQFHAQYPNINVQMQTIPSNQYIAQAQADLTGQHGADVFASFPGAEFTAIAKAGLYTDLTNQSFMSNFNPNLIQSGQQDGKQLAVPYQVVFNMPVYNKDLFKKLNLSIPTNWDEFLKVCQTLKDHGYAPILLAGQGNSTLGQFFNDMVMNNVPDPTVFTGLMTGKSKLTDPGFMKTLQQFSELVSKGYIKAGALGTSQDAAEAIFAQGKTGMYGMGSYEIAPVNKDNNSAFAMGLMAPITTTNAADAKYQGIDTTTFMLGVNANSAHKKEAEEFINFLSDAKVASDYANTTDQMVTVKGVTYTEPALVSMQGWLDKPLRFQPMYTLTNQQVVDAVTNAEADVLSGMSAQAAATKEQKIIDQALSLK